MARFAAASVAHLIPCLVLFFGVTRGRGAWLISGDHRCSQPGMKCSLSSSNCVDPAWAHSHRYTPSGPDHLDLRISTRRDLNGNLLPVINASWTLKDEGSISFLNASELHVLVVSTNQNICVRYSFSNKLTMRSTTGDKWMLTSDVLVVDPGQSYRVSVENIPKPEIDHSGSSISRDLHVPDCSDPEMNRTQPCVDSGAQWRPNILLSHSGGTSLTVDFSPDPRSEQYMVLCHCDHRDLTITKTLITNGSRLSASFPLDQWDRTCCRFHVQIKPFFSGCGNDCRRHRSSLDLCRSPSREPSDPDWDPLPVVLGASFVLFLAVLVGVCVAIVCRVKAAKVKNYQAENPLLLKHSLEEHPTLLLIYSRDHPLFLDVVLQLAAFLQGHCGVVVLLDLLDSSTVSQVGLMRWLELQRNKLRPSDKIMVLCSRGVQVKWRAMCGQGHVTYQPDDLIGPFISLFLSDLQRPGSMGRFIAAHFDDISSEQDVPSFFDIAVKYKLMKHFEELYFRVLDIEKYEPRKVHHVEGIGPDQYFTCPSGNQLRNAIEKFHAFQVENPDWFEKGSMEDVDDQSLLLKYEQDEPQIFERVPVVREGHSIFTNDVLMNQNMDHLYVVAPELRQNSMISENKPVPNSTTASQNQSVLELMPDLSWNSPIFQSNVIPVIPTNDEKVHGCRLGQSDRRVAAILRRDPQPVEMEVIPEMEQESTEETSGFEQEALEEPSAEPSAVQSLAEDEVNPWSKEDTSGSDQGYSSKAWTEPDSEALKALMQLQQELMSSTCL